MIPNQGIFVTGTDTAVGKSYVAVKRIQSLREGGVRVGAYKPVASGGLDSDSSDTRLLWNALGRSEPQSFVTPQSFAAPLAPPIAAEMEGKSIDELLLVSGAEAWSGRCEFLVVEGAGGLLSPISWNYTNADIAVRLGYPLIVVAHNRLGVVHQILATIVAAKSKGLKVQEVVLNDMAEMENDVVSNTNEKLLMPFLFQLDPSVVIRRLRSFE